MICFVPSDQILRGIYFAATSSDENLRKDAVESAQMISMDLIEEVLFLRAHLRRLGANDLAVGST